MPPAPSQDSPEPVLRIRDLQKSYEGRVILRGITFHVHAGERVALTGPSGSGKTTLLNCLGGVDRPDAGSILLGTTPLEAMDDEALALFRRHRVGTVFQFFHLLPTLTAAENVELPLQLLGVPRADRVTRVRTLLDRVGVAHRSRAFPSELSGGERQRVAIARAMGHGPELLLADEPTGNLDSVNGANILRLLTEWTEETKTALVLVTHSPEAASICHREIHLKDGQIESGMEGSLPS